ncbi:MAG: S-formylglutathione hydrolase [Myxococcota bacterium]|nr:S-formylglutathione hydrolase [Myxococcota bacterium]
MQIKTYSEHSCFGGKVGFYGHGSKECAGEMKFAVYQPPQAAKQPPPTLYYLSGLTCTPETFLTKAGALRLAAEMGLQLVAPDTSPRGKGLPGEGDSWDFGSGAGFYLDATQSPWATYYNMYSYVTEELPAVVEQHFPGAGPGLQSIFGHSMGGHGALTIGLRNPGKYRSISAFAPICAPSQCPWGQKAFRGYLGEDRGAWAAYDATELVRTTRHPAEILIDQGLSDGFLEEQLHPHLFEAACKEHGQALKLRRHPGYDHGYYFISTLMEDHLRHHARHLL